MRVWKNSGAGATKIKADGNRYCNMLGHENGMMDYVWILSKGDMRIFENQGKTSVEDDGPNFWGPDYVMFDPKKAIWRDLDRRDLHLVDWDGDGVCDIVWMDPANQNRPRVWRNRYKETGNFDWQYESNPAPDLWCPEQRGLGFFDRPVHLADISGNKRADYLCVEKDGRTWGFVQSDVGTWEHIDQFKFSEEKDRANLYWADVNGDGRADMIHTNKFNGDGTVWLNKGRKDVGGSRFEWEPLGARFAGAAAGACTYYPDLDGNGRADMHVITHSLDNTAKTWFSRCGRPNKVGDDGIVSDPHLPVSPDGTDEDPDGGKDLEWSDYFPEDDEEGLDYDFEDAAQKTLLLMLESDIRNYTEILDDSYDKKFNTYSKAVVEGAPQFVHEFRMNNGTDYDDLRKAGGYHGPWDTKNRHYSADVQVEHQPAMWRPHLISSVPSHDRGSRRAAFGDLVVIQPFFVPPQIQYTDRPGTPREDRGSRMGRKGEWKGQPQTHEEGRDLSGPTSPHPGPQIQGRLM
ncbi:hypothetical protein BDV12DRAFT_204408 [Aspergillus spectabilis]